MFIPCFLSAATSSGEPLICAVVWGGKTPSLAPCCSWCCGNYSVVWGIFGLTFCIPFASQRDWNKSKHYGLPCGKLIALDVYVLVFSEQDCTVWSLPGYIWQSVVFASIFMCFFLQLCAIMQKMLWKFHNYSYNGCRATCLLMQCVHESRIPT